MSTWLVPRQEMTPDQLRAVELDPRENRVILGGPGSGKTQILLHRGQHLCERLGAGAKDFRIFVYTNALRAYIQSALPLLNLPDESVSTLDHWCKTYFEEHIDRPVPWNGRSGLPDFAAIRTAVLATLRTCAKKPFRFVLADEAQDLDEEALRILTASADHVTVCADHKQQIYDHGSGIGSILECLGVRHPNMKLLETYRCSPYIVQLAAQLLRNPEEREAYLQQVCTDPMERETPLLVCAHDGDEEKGELIQVLQTRLIKGERVAVLFPQRRQAFGYAHGLNEQGIQCEDPEHLDFASDRPKFMPYHSAKGLTFDSVLLPRLVDKSFGRMTPRRVEHLLFVGITRATKWVYMSTTANGPSSLLHPLLPGEQRGCLSVRRTERPPSHSAPDQPPRTKQDDILDLL